MLEEQFLKDTLIRYLKQQNVSLKSLNEIHKRIEFFNSMLAELKITMSDGLPFEKFKVDLSENYLIFFHDNLITDIQLLDSYINDIILNQSFSELSKAIELSISLSKIIKDIDNFFDFDKYERYKSFKNIKTFILLKIIELDEYKLLKIKDKIQVINPQALNAFNLGFYLLMEMDEIPFGNYKRGLYDYYFDYFNCVGFHGMQWTFSNNRCILPRQFFEIAFNLDSNFSEAKIYFELCDYFLNKNVEKFKNEVVIANSSDIDHPISI